MKYWIHAQSQFTQIAGVLADLTGKAKVKWPNNVLSITENLAGTEVIIKVDTDDAAWIENNVIVHSPQVIRVHTEIDHNELKALVHTPAWEAQ